MAKRRRKSRKKKNPFKKGHRPWNKGRSFHKGPKRKRGRRHYVSNPRRRRARRRNPGGMKVVGMVALAVGAGIVGSVVAGMALDYAWPSGTRNEKIGILGVMAVGSAWLLGAVHPALAAGLATGFLLVPGQQFVAGLITPATTASSSSSGATQTAGLHAGGIRGLHSRGIGRMSAGAVDLSDAEVDAELARLGLDGL